MAKRIGIALIYDPLTGENSLNPSTDFMDESILMQIDCIKDWLYDLEVVYDKGRDHYKSEGGTSHHKNLFKEEL